MENIILYVDCKGEALEKVKERLDCKNFYAYNPEVKY